MSYRILTILVILLSCIFPGSTQNISIDYTNPSGPNALVVCNSAPFDLSVTNTANDDATNVTLTVQFPTGVYYNIGSISNASELDITDLNNPVFSVPDLAASQTQNIQLSARADCELIAAINAMELFSNSILVNYDNGSNNVATTPYNIETPLLVMTNSGNLILFGSQGDVLTRTFTITNTRLGPLSSFTFQDSHQGGIEISTNLGTDISSQTNIFEALLDGDDFMTIGDGDNLFELDESITITEEILITSCGNPLTSTLSNINAFWGCNAEVCQTTTTIEGYIGIEISYVEPELTFTPISNETPLCFCTGLPLQQGLTISNNSPHTATDIGLDISQLSSIAGFDAFSFVVDSSGFIDPLEGVIPDTSVMFGSQCNVSTMVHKNVVFSIPILEAGQSITIYWDIYICALDCIGDRNTPWIYNYDYYSVCPPLPHITGQGQATGDSPEMDGLIINTVPGPILDGSTTTFNYHLFSDEFLLSGEQLTVNMEIPCGFSWEPTNDLILDGQDPQNFNINITDTVTFVSATYNLPFSNDSILLPFDLSFECANLCEELICKDTIITTCPSVCESDSPTGLLLIINSSLQLEEGCPDECNVNTCSTLSLPLDCELPLCVETVPGYAKYNYTTFRTNYGLPDNNNDRIADAGGDIDLNLIRQDRVIVGDTVQVDVNSVVVIDEPGHTFPYGQIFININSSLINYALNGDLFDNGGLLPIDQQLTIYDNSSNTYYNCGLTMPLTINTLTDGAFSFQFDISPEILTGGSCSLPANFEYDSGDSILLKQQFRINYNLVPFAGGSTPPIIDLNFSPQVFLFNDNTIPKEDLFNCGCSFSQMEMSGYKYNIVSGIHAIPDCDTSTFVGGTLFSFLLGEGNFFPYEHRSLGQLTDWQIELPAGFSITSSKLTSMELQENVSLFNDVPLTPGISNNTYQYNLVPFQTPLLDEGFSMLIQNQFLASCQLTGSYPLTIHSQITPAPNLLLPDIIDSTVFKPAALRMLLPSLILDATFFNNTSYDDQAKWDFTITNIPSFVASFVSDAADHVWVYPVSPTGLVSNFVLTDTVTGTTFPQVNGIFQLGALDTFDIFALRLTATNSSCDEETIVLNYGWNCSPYNNPITTPCSQKQSLFTVLSPPAALEQTVESPIGPHFLCDTIGYHTITIFNADLGTAYNALIETQLPPGLYILPGTSEIAYPTGTTFVPVADPTNTGTGTMQWDISALQDTIGQNGLPGFIFNPDHSFQLRFKMYTDCDFIAGSYPIFFAEAEQICGDPTNTLAEAAEPIQLNGLPPPYGSSISALTNLPTISCQDSISVEISIVADASTINGDSIFITLPIGISYVSNSIVGNSNAIVQEPNISNNNNLQILKWPLSAGILPGQSIAFEFMLSGFSALECGNHIMLLQTVGPASALCTADNSICDILVETGSNIVQLNIDRANYSLSDFEINISPSGNNELVDYTITVENNGFLSEPPTIIDFYLDTDNSGTWTPADVLVSTDVFSNSLSNGDNIVLTGSFMINAGLSCQLIAVIDENKHCACMGDEQVINTTITYIIPTVTQACSAQDQTIGVDFIAGATYQWTPETGLNCDDCSMTEINLVNNSNTSTTHVYTLTEDDGQGCITAYEFTIELQPQPGITNTSGTICPGDSILLTATTANSYLWNGPGITNPGLPTQWVTPTVDALYTVQLTDAFGCSGVDSILVMVATPPTAFAGNDTLFCENSTVQLQALFDADYSYQWEPAAFLDDPISPNPTIINNIATTYTLIVTNTQGCQNTDQVSVDFGAAPLLIGPQEANICSGDSVLIEFSGALNYEWTPTTGLSCTDCASVYAFPSTSTTYLVTGSDAIGCSSTVSVTVGLLSGPATEEAQSICEGESILVFGETISEAGIYCDTITSMLTGCDSVHCVAVELLPDVNTEEEQVICEGETFESNGVVYTAAGMYCSDLQTVDGCDSTHCLILEINPNPVIDIFSEVSVQLGDTLQLGPYPAEYTYSWSPSEGLSCDNCPDPIASPTVDTDYTVIVMDEAGCSNAFTISTRTTLPVCERPFIFIPNAFSPNSDGENDELRVFGNGIERLHLAIFNRWGQKVFETFEVDGYWDGIFNGEQLHPDVFGYLLEVDCVGGESFFEKGNITLLK